MNVVVLRGRLSRPVQQRDLPSGDRLATLDLTVAAGEAGKAESVPLAWFDAPTWIAEVGEGAELVVAGRVRRRFFRSGPAVQSRTEVVVESAARAERGRQVAALLRRVEAQLLPDVEVGRTRRRAPATFPK